MALFIWSSLLKEITSRYREIIYYLHCLHSHITKYNLDSLEKKFRIHYCCNFVLPDEERKY